MRAIENILKQGIVVKNGRGQYQRKQNIFSKIDDFWKNLIWHTIYGFYQHKTAPAKYAFSKLSAGIDCKFPYGRTMLQAYLVTIGSQYQKADNQQVIMKNDYDNLLGSTST